MLIRQYRDEDRENVRKICGDTAFKSYRNNPKKREIVCLLCLDYYLDYEKENCFVLDDNGVAVGYITACTNYNLFKDKQKNVYGKKIAKLSFIHNIFNKMCIKANHELNKKYNGQFHINIDEKYQGGGYGPKLLKTLCVNLNKKGFKYIYLATKNRKTRGYSFYKHFGFEEVKSYFGGAVALAFNTNKIPYDFDKNF